MKIILHWHHWQDLVVALLFAIPWLAFGLMVFLLALENSAFLEIRK